MPPVLSIAPFNGLRNRSESRDEYMEDIEFAYETSCKASKPTKEDKDHICRILFRQHLQADAVAWYSELPIDVKSNWDQLHESFRKVHGQVDQGVTDKFIPAQRILPLRQAPTEPIAHYLQRTEELYRNLPAQEEVIGQCKVKGMREVEQQKRVMFECARKQDYSFE